MLELIILDKNVSYQRCFGLFLRQRKTNELYDGDQEKLLIYALLAIL
jgi:hypothetical protein